MGVIIYAVEVSGRTYGVKEKLKEFGLIWDGNRKVWKGTVSEDGLRKLNKLADKFQIQIEIKTKHELKAGRSERWVRCWECGRLVPAWQAQKDVNGEWYCGC